MDEMDLDAEKNEMPYNDYGKLLRDNKLTVIQIVYDGQYVLVQDPRGQLWKVTAMLKTFTAVLTRVS